MQVISCKFSSSSMYFGNIKRSTEAQKFVNDAKLDPRTCTRGALKKKKLIGPPTDTEQPEACEILTGICTHVVILMDFINFLHVLILLPFLFNS